MAGLHATRTRPLFSESSRSPAIREGGPTLTIRQGLILRFMVSHLEHYGLPPTLGEIAHALGVTRITVWEHLRGMERLGLITIQRRQRRGAVPCSHCPTCGRAWRSGEDSDASGRNPERVFKVVPELK